MPDNQPVSQPHPDHRQEDDDRVRALLPNTHDAAPRLRLGDAIGLLGTQLRTLRERLAAAAPQRAVEVVDLQQAVDLLQRSWQDMEMASEMLSQQHEELVVASEELVHQNEELVAVRFEAETESLRYQDLFNFAPDGYLVTDLSGIVMEANRAALQLLNLRADHARGRILASFVAPPERRAFRTLMLDLRAGARGAVQLEATLAPRRRDPFAAALTVAVTNDALGRPLGLRWMIRDISDRKRAEQQILRLNEDLERRVQERTAELERSNVALRQEIEERQATQERLRESEDRYRLMVEEVQDYAIFMMDPEGCIATWNSGAQRVLGYGEAAILGESAAIIFTPEDRERGEPQKELETARQEGRALDERWHLRKDGERFFASGVLTALRDNDGHLRGFAKVMRDVTERRRMDEQLRKAHQDLECRVEERTRELTEANAALRREVAERRRVQAARRQLLRRLVSAQEEERRRVSRELHDELGQHLTGLLLGLKSLQTDEEALPAGERCGSASQIRRMQEVADWLMRQTHRLAAELRPAVLDDWGLVTALGRMVSDWAERSGVEVDFQSTLADDPRLHPEVESTVYRVVQEALTNVLRHAEASRVSVVVERGRGEGGAEMVSAIIEDNGRGFDAEAVLQANGGTDRLGLLGMRERVELVDGSLTIESAPGSGTTIFVRIPLAIDD